MIASKRHSSHDIKTSAIDTPHSNEYFIILLMASVVWIFVLVELTNILINLDHGILPACTQEIAEFYHIGQTELGMLGSIVYLGIIVTGLYVGRLYQLIQSKLVCLIGLTGMCVSLLMFVLSHQVWLAMTSRFLTGAFQVFMLVYFPVWIDKFGGDRATLWITLLQVGVPLGIFAGYGMTSVIVTSTGVVPTITILSGSTHSTCRLGSF